MRPVKAPLKVSDRGPEVANLQDALQFLIEHGVIRTPEPDGTSLLERLARDRQQEFYSDNGTYPVVQLFQKQNGISVTGNVDGATAAKLNETLRSLRAFDDLDIWTVQGRVTQAGKPKIGIKIEVYDRDLRKRQLLGHALTDSYGKYYIEYRLADFAQGDRRDRAAPWLVVEAMLAADGPRVVAQKGRDVQREETVNLTFEAVLPSEFERLSEEVLPLLNGQRDDGGSLTAWELHTDDIPFLVTESGIDRDQMQLWILAAQTARNVSLFGSSVARRPRMSTADTTATPADENLEWLVFYGWFRDGQPNAFSDLIAMHPNVLMESLARAIVDGRIPALTQGQLDGIRQTLNDRRIVEALKIPPKERPATLGTLLSLVGGTWLTPELQQKIAPELLDAPVESETFLERLKPLVPNEDHRRELRRTLRLGDLTLRHAPMVEALRRFAETSGDDTMSGLASIELDRWLDLAYEHEVPRSSPMTPEDYARRMRDDVEHRVPTAALAHWLGSHPFFSSTASYMSLIPVLKRHPGFDVETADLEAFAKEANLDATQEDSLKRLQNLKRVGAWWEETGTLLERGIDSVAAIIDLGPDGFKAEMRDILTEDRINAIYNQSRARHIASVGLMGYMQPLLFSSAQPVVLAERGDAATRLIDKNPTLRNLFGPLETCTCQHCLSVLSPAAYLVDLLKFVDASPASAYELRERRPDLYDLDLSCDNSQIALLHIDLVNEILENKVALPLTVPLEPGVNAEDEIKRLPIGARVKAELQRTTMDPLGDLTAVKDRWSNRLLYYADRSFWVVTDRHRRWVLEASTERLWLLSSAFKADVDLHGLEMADVIAALNNGVVHPSVRERFEQALIETQRPQIPVTVEAVTISQIANDQWTVDFSLVGTAQVLIDQGTLVLTGSPQVESKRNYSGAALEAAANAFNKGQLATIFEARTPRLARKLTIANAARGWVYHSTHSVRLIYRVSSLTIEGLTYQSTTPGEDLLTRPQNRNPLAYVTLNSPEVKFPWTLPYDANLCTTRALLSKAGTSRLALLEFMDSSEYSSKSMSIVREVLGLSAEEASRIRTVAAGDDLWAVWGLKKPDPGAKDYAVFDTFADETATGTALSLLGRVSVLMQQARLSFVELQQVLASTWVNPDRTPIAPDYLCDPTKLTVAVTEPLLDRFHRFVRLWRATSWQIWELDLALRNQAIAVDVLGNQTFRNLSHLQRLISRLGQPLEVLLTWFSSGFTNEPHVVDRKGELVDVRSLYDRLFFDRRLVMTPDSDLAFSNVDAKPPTTTKTLSDKAPLLAAAFGVRESIVRGILESEVVDPGGVSAGHLLTNGNLVWLYRSALLMRSCRLSADEYEAAWRVRNGTPFASPSDLLAFLDDLDQVRHSGTTWRALEYVLRGTGEEDTAFSAAQAGAILAAIQRSVLAQPDRAAADSYFGLTAKDLAEPALSTPPQTEVERWTRWGFTPTQNGIDWTVANPDSSAANTRLSGPPMTLLARSTVLAQQLGASIGEVRSLLQTRFISPDVNALLSMAPAGGGNPELVVTNLAPIHLDRLERMAALWRRSGLNIRDLDLMIRAVAVTNPAEPLTDNLATLVEQGPAMVTLRDRLGVTLDTVIAWKGGIGGRDYRTYESSGVVIGVDSGVFDRLFAGIGTFAMTPAHDRLEIEATPPAIAPSWPNLFSALALALGVPVSELTLLWTSGIVSPAVTLANLETIHRTITLSTALGLSSSDFMRFAARFARKQGKDWRTSPVTTLAFVNVTLAERRRSDTVASQVAGAFGLDNATAADLLWGALDVVPQVGIRISAMEMFLESPLLDSDAVLDSAILGATSEYAVLVRLNKLRLLNGAWKATPTELRWLWKQVYAPAAFTGLSLNILPVMSGDAPAAFLDWRRTTTLFTLAHSSSGVSNMLRNYLAVLGMSRAASEIKAAYQSLGIAYGLAPVRAATEVGGFAAFVGLDVPVAGPNPPPQLDPLRLAQLLALLGTARRLGLDASAFRVLAADPPTAESVSIARAVLRSRFSDAAWAKMLRESNDQVRETERDRLVDYLVWREGARNADALYERYLIDVQMAACMTTTRLLQSIAAVQLFVQRCLFNLEQPQVVADDIPNRDRWEWMRNYRVWEANRKVFLYPENWLYPELRDDRSETFRAFESGLMQSEPSHENAINALRQYIDDLVDVSQITVLGLYEHEDRMEQTGLLPPATISSLYLIGRSQNPPYRFFWRKATPYGVPGTRWTGWERVDAELSGDHAVPFILGGDFHVAWPVIKQIEKDNNKHYFELQLAIARRAPTGWTKRQVSREKLTVERLFDRTERDTFFLNLRTLERGRSVAVDVWSVEERPPPNLTLDNATFKLTYMDQHKTGIYYWQLRLRVAASLKYRDTGRVVDWPCKVMLHGVESDTAHYDPSRLAPNPLGSSGPYSAAELSARTLEILGGPELTVEAFFEVESQQVSSTVTYRFTNKNEELHNREPEGGDKYEAIATFIVTGVDDDLTASERDQLDMKIRGSFRVEEGREIERDLTVNQPVMQHRIGFRFVSSGYLEFVPGVLGFKPAADSSGGGRLFALGSGPVGTPYGVDTTYLEEEGIRWLIRTSRMSIGSVDAAAIPEYRTAIYTAGFSDPPSYKAQASQRLADLFSIDTQGAPLNSELDISTLSRFIRPGIKPYVDPRGSSLVQFDLSQPYAGYNWELFFHLPLAAAIFLSRQHRFEDARRWFHYVFDPTTNDPSTGRERFWRFLPFRHASQTDSITRLLEILGDSDAPEAARLEVQKQVAAWLADPFNPFAIARLRPSAFELYTVFAYVKNLLTWGDQLFRRDTRESLNEATLLYVLAATILGRRQERIPKRGTQQTPLSYRALEGQWDDFGNVWLSLADNPLVQKWIEFLEWLAVHGINNPQSLWDQIAQLSSIGSLYFCVPPNEKLPELWDAVDDRLFKIRHCQNIEGVERELPFFEPPIDPELLIRARAAGLDLADVLADRFAPLPYQRFQVLLQKANEFCAEVKSLGGALLATLEKKEGEQLALLRSQQEIEILRLVEIVRADQQKEAEANIEALEKTRRNTLDRFAFLQRQLGKSDLTLDSSGAPIVEQTLMTQVQESGAPDDFRSLALVQAEIDQVGRLQDGHVWSMVSGVVKAGAAAAHLVGLNPLAKGGAEAAGFALSATAEGLALIATNASFWERRASLISGWQRRRDEWVQQSKMTAVEIRQIDKQLIALQVRKEITQKELENHRKQIEFATNIDDFLRHLKFTGESLYAWMEGQLASVHFAAYQLAYDLARRAERAFRFELGDESASFVHFGHWDNLRKGLLAGERLGSDLRRMEAAYLDRNRRELEITKHISLRGLDPAAFLDLRAIGECEFHVPEELFDMDFPGHYYRRLKTVSVSVPCVAGPYTGITGTLTLLSSSLREKNITAGDYSDEANFRVGFLPIQSIATSSGQNDAGLFELNFRDERYLPFEGAGAISKWRLALPGEIRQFDYNTISDVILHVRYTARDGGTALRDQAIGNLKTRIAESTAPGMVRLFSVRHEFPSEWAKFRNVTLNDAIKTAELSLHLREEHYPYWSKGFLQSVKEVAVLAKVIGDATEIRITSDAAGLGAKDPDGEEKEDKLSGTLLEGFLHGNLVQLKPAAPVSSKDDPLRLFFNNNLLADLWLAVTWGEGPPEG